MAGGAGLAIAQEATPQADQADLRPGVREPGGPTISDKVFDLKADPDAIFAFVRDEVRYEAYPGALRGPLGTLWGLAGNSVDQSQLLAAMLNEAKVRTRYAFGAIDEETGAALLQGANLALSDAVEHAARVHAVPDAPDTGELTEEQQQALNEMIARAEELAAAARSQLTDGVETIMTVLAGAGVTLPEVSHTLPERERTQHVWIQYASGAEWIDLDPSLADANPGKTYAAADLTVDTLPDDLYHSITFRITAEKLFGGQATRAELLSHRARSQDLVGTSLTLIHLPPDSLKALGAAIDGAADGTTQYIPHLAVGGNDVVAGTDRITLVAGGGLMDVFGGETRGGDTIAEWLEVDIVSPDLPVRHAVRTVFDRAGERTRDGLPFDADAIPPADLRNFGDGSGDVFLPMAQVWSIVASCGDVPITYFDQDLVVNDLYGNLSLLLYGYHLARESLSRGLADIGSPRIMTSRPNLTAMIVAARDLAPESPSFDVAIDLLDGGVAAVPWEDFPSSGAEAQVAAGVLSHVCERLSTSLPDNVEAASLPPQASVGRLFEDARAQDIDLVVLLPGTPVHNNVSMSAQATALVDSALNEGFVVIVPASPIDLGEGPITGWWQVHLETAETRDVLENGRSTNALGYADTVRVVAQATPAMRRMAQCKMLVIYMYAGLALSVGGLLFGAGAAAGGGFGGAAFLAGSVATTAGAFSGGVAGATAAALGC